MPLPALIMTVIVHKFAKLYINCFIKFVYFNKFPSFMSKFNIMFD